LIERDDLQKIRSFIADVADVEQKISGEFPLKTEIKLLNIRGFQVFINKKSGNRLSSGDEIKKIK